MSIFQVLIICGCGVIGALFRYFIIRLFEKFFARKSYLGIAIVNIISSAVIGVILFSKLNTLYDKDLLFNGLLGGFTSYSSLIFEVLKLALKMNYLFAFLYLVFTLLMSFMIFYLGFLVSNLL